MITPFPFIIWSLGPGWPCWKRCEGNHFQMCTIDGALGARLRGMSCRAEAIDAPCLLPIFKFSAPYGTHPVTSSKPLLRPTLCRLLKPKKQTPLSNSLVLQQGGAVSNESVLQTASSECKPPWQQKAAAQLKCPWIPETSPVVMAVLVHVTLSHWWRSAGKQSWVNR